MARVELNIVALGDFSSVSTQIKALQAQVDLLNKSVVGVGLGSNLTKDLNSAAASFKNTMLSTGAFTQSTVKLTTETQKFGQALVSGKLALSDYYNIVTNKSGSAVNSVKALAVEQTKLQNSVVMADPTKQGFYSVFTPTTINKVTDATKIAANEQNIYNLAVENGSKALINWGKNTQWAGRQLTVGLTVPLMLFASQATSSFKDVNIELTRLQRLYGEGLTPPSQAELNQISAQVTDLGKNVASSMGIAVKDTVQVAANFAAMGRQGQNLLDTTYQTQRLSKLGAVDATAATNTIVALQNVYKVSTNQLADAVNFLSDIQKQTTMTLGDMTEAIPRVGPIMQQLGGTYKDTAVMLVAMREAGIPAAQAANAVKSAIASMIAPTRSAVTAAQQFGISLNAVKNAGTPVQMIEKLQEGLSKLSPLAKEQVIEKIFGKFQFARVSALLDNFGKVGSQTQNALKIAGATSTELATLANQEMQQATSSPTAKYQRALETFKADLLPVGQKIIEITTSLMNFGNTVAKIFSGLPGPIKSILGIAVIGTVLAGPIIMLTGLMANFLGYITKTVFNLKQLATGGMTLRQLLTPEIIASQQAADLFSKGILGDVESVDLLNQAIKNLTITMEGLVASMNAGTGINAVESIIATEAGLAGGRIPFRAPGMASGGFVPGTGNTDSFPAMLTPGEAVIPKGPAAQYAPFISSMIRGNLPGFAYGLDPMGNKVRIERGHIYSAHGQNILDKARAMLNSQSRLSDISSVESGVMMGMTNPLNQNVRGTGEGMSGSQVGAELRKFETLKGPSGQSLDPMIMIKKNAERLGADMSKAAPLLDKAYKDLIESVEKQTNIVFGKGKGQVPLEEWMQKQLQPILQKIETKVGGNLDTALSNVVGPRGTQKLSNNKTKNASGATLYINEKGDLIPLKESGTGLVHGEVSTYGGSMPGAFSSQKQAIIKESTKQLDDTARIALDEHSNSKKGVKTGKEYIGGVTQGVEEAAPSLWTEGKQTVNNLEKGIDEGLNGPVARSKIQRILKKPNGGLSLMAKIGASSALMMGGQMATSMLPQGSNLAAIGGSVSSMAGMGMMFGPYGAAAGAAIGLLTGGISALMKAEKEQQEVAKASFSSSAELAQIFGTNVTNATTPVAILTDKVSGSSQALSGFSKDVRNTVDAINKLPANNPLKLLLNNMTNTTAENAKNLAKAFITAQMALNGMDPKKAQDIYNILMGASKHAQAIGQASNLPKSTKEAVVAYASGATTDSTRYVSGSKGGEGTVIHSKAKSYNELNDTGKQSADKLANVVNSLIGMDATSKEYKDTLDGLNSKSINQKEAMSALALSYGRTDKEVAKQIDLMNKNGLSVSQAALLFKASAINSQGAAKEIMDNLKDNLKKGTDPKKLGDLWAKLIKEIADAAKKGNTGGASSNDSSNQSDSTYKPFTGTAQEKEVEKVLQENLKAQNAQLKIARDELSVQNKIAQEAKQQLQYQQQITGLQNDMKTAMISGNYLQAAALKQQISSVRVDFNSTSVQTKMQNQVDELQSNADQINQGLSDLKDAIANGKTTIDKSILAAKGLSVLRAKEIVGGVASGASVNTIININGSVDQKSINAVSSAVATAVKKSTKVKSMATKVTAGKSTKK
jgi:TP901 family phage tail tape measure protein